MSSTWKTVRVFISSTFRDMHAERDHLVKVVFPALRELLEKYRVYLIDIDLRWGVTREQAENDQVLDLCLQQIEECRPFFLGILGERYGWVPKHYPADALKKFGWIQHHTGKSVTELEILHGVLQNPQMRGHAFFYFRDLVATHAVPEAVRRSVYAETDPEQIENLAELKKKIRYSGYPVMENYPARWDPEAYDRPSKSKGRLVDLEAFGERVRDQLWEAIQAEHQLPEKPLAETQPDPLAEELDYHNRFMESRLRVYVGREHLNRDLFAFAEGDEPVSCLVTGPSGSGKSAALARFVTDYRQQHPQTLVVPHFVGASPRSTSVREMLRRFCLVLKARFSFAEEIPAETARLMVTFREFLNKVPADARVLLVIDALNQLDEAERGQQLEWLPPRMPPHVKVVVSCITDHVGSDRIHAVQPGPDESGHHERKPEPALLAFEHRVNRPVQIEPLRDAERWEIIRQVPSLSAKTLDEHQIGLLLANPATANPLFLLIALEELRGFGSYEQLNGRIASLPREGGTVTALFTQVVERLEEEFDKEVVQSVLSLLASARRGLSDRELLDLVEGPGGKMAESKSDLFPVLRQLRPYLLSRAGLIDFYHRNLFKAVGARYLNSEEKQRAAHVRLAEYFDGQPLWLPSEQSSGQRLANIRKVYELLWQQKQANNWKAVDALLTNLQFIEAKCAAGMTHELVDEYKTVLAQPTLPPQCRQPIEEFARFVRAKTHLLTRWPALVCPLAALEPDRLAQGRAARERLEGGTETRPWLRWVNRPEDRSECLLVLGPRPAGYSSPQRRPGWHPLAVTACVLSPDGTRVLAGYASGTVAIWDLATGAERFGIQEMPDGEVRAVAFSPDGARFLTLVSCMFWPKYTRNRMPSALTVRDAATGVELWRLAGCTSSWEKTTGFSPDGSLVVCGFPERIFRLGEWDEEENAQLRLLDARTGEVRHTLRQDGDTFVCHDFSADGSRLLTGSQSGRVQIWDSYTGVCLFTHNGSRRCVNCAFSLDGSRVLAALHDVLLIFDAATLTPLVNMATEGKNQNNWIRYGVFSPDGSRILTISGPRLIQLWDTVTGAELVKLKEPVTSLCHIPCRFSPDGSFFLAALEKQQVRVWDTATGTERLTLAGHTAHITAAVFTSDGRNIHSSSYDGTVRLWDIGMEDGSERTLEARGVCNSIAFSPDGRRVVSAHRDGTLRYWDTAGQEITILSGHTKEVLCCAFSPDGRHLLSGSDDQTLRLWNAHTGAAESTLGHTIAAKCCAFSPDGSIILSGCWNGTMNLWDAATGAEIAALTRPNTLSGGQGTLWDCGFSPDGRWIASAGALSKGLGLWDGRTGAETADLHEPDDSVFTFAFSPDGRLVATGSGSYGKPSTMTVRLRTLKVWDVVSGTETVRFNAPRSSISACAFSPDGLLLATGSEDRAIRFWNPATGSLQATLTGHGDDVRWCDFSADGKYLASKSSDGTLKVWHVGATELVAEFSSERGVTCPSWGPDGRTLALCDDHGKVHLLRLENAGPVVVIITAWHALDDGLFAFGCPHCQAWSEVPAAVLGTEHDCPSCQTVVQVNPFVIEGDWRAIQAGWSGANSALRLSGDKVAKDRAGAQLAACWRRIKHSLQEAFGKEGRYRALHSSLTAEALWSFKQQEKLCRELGLDDELARCQAELARLQARVVEAKE